MNGRRPTDEQMAAITSGCREVLVEAGAGTGKTGVMVDRYCRLIREQGVAPDSILAFTFTDKAAGELRQRIRAEIPSLNGDWVTTIHGFCNRLLSSHPVAVGIDPRFRVLDAPETARIAAEAFDEALREFLTVDTDEREATLAAFDVGGLQAIAIATHAELRSRGEAEPALPQPPETDLIAALGEARRVAADTLAEVKPGSDNHELVAAALELLDAEAVPGLDALAALRTTKTAKALGEYREAIEAAVSRVAEAGAGGRAYRHVAEIVGLFSNRFAAAKERRGGIDFEDLQILAVRLLEQTETGAAYRSRFGHILVDEFQDTNRLQLRLIEALHGDHGQLMVVGDELQSIYGFRHADLGVFRERRERIAASADGEVLPLSGNFRSRPELIGAINALGAELLGEAFRPLRVGSPTETPPAPGDGPAVELLLTAKEGWDEEGVDLEPATDGGTPSNQLAEARFVAERLRDLAADGIERGSMVVLLRSFTRLDAYEDSLERAGLRPYVVGGRGYWSQQQVADVRALLATIANPLDDESLLGALASPAAGVAPDTLWLLRAAAGRGRHLWPAIEALAGEEAEEGVDAERLAQIPAGERSLLTRFAADLAGLRADAVSLPLPSLIDAAVTRTGYDLTILMRPSGEARFANVRKLMRLASDFERTEGRDPRGFLDFLDARAEADADAQAATAVEGHDGVRIMTVHGAKGLEFDVVAVPLLARGLLPPARAPLLTLGQEPGSPRVGMELRRLGARGVKLYEQRSLCEELERRQAEEELRLFHVAATRARKRLVLSGVIAPNAPKLRTGSSVIERIALGFEIDRDADSELEIAAPEPRSGLEAAFAPSAIPVRLNAPSKARAAELRRTDLDRRGAIDPGTGPAPLLRPRVARGPGRHLSYSAIAAELGHTELELSGERTASEGEGGGLVRGRAVHALLEWSHAHDWGRPPDEVVRRITESAEVDAEEPPSAERLLSALEAWLGSRIFSERVSWVRSRAELPLLLDLDGTILRGSIDLLVETDGRPPLIVDFKTDRVGDADVTALSHHYDVQKEIYAVAVSQAREIEEVELAYVFLERPEEPVFETWGPDQLEAARAALGRRLIIAAGS